MRKARIVFCGTSEFAIPALRALSYESHPLLVISQPQKPQGRKLIPQPSELARCAMELDLKVFTPGDINSEESLETVQAFLQADRHGQLWGAAQSGFALWPCA